MNVSSSKLIWGVSLASMAVLASWSLRPVHVHSDGNPYHSRAFLRAYDGLPDTSNALFTGSGKCAGCHGTDPIAYANVTADGADINPTSQWRSSLMANSAKDPFWRAKVAHEVAVNPDHQLELEDKCTSCHAPLGHFNAHHIGEEHYSMAQLFQDSLALDGVSCVACHQQSPTVGNTFSGVMAFDSAMIYGQYGAGKDDEPLLEDPMMEYVGYNIGYGAHVDGSEICAGCHSLVTQTADLDGNLTGADYVEQATYHEWLNSAYADDGETPMECQDCHMPKVEEGVVISSGYAWLQPRSPYSEHILVGGNVQMLEIMRDNVNLLGLNATEAQFDSTIAWTKHLLRNETAELTIEQAEWVDGEGHMVVQVRNKAGHKFPQAILHVGRGLRLLPTKAGTPSGTVASGRLVDFLWVWMKVAWTRLNPTTQTLSKKMRFRCTNWSQWTWQALPRMSLKGLRPQPRTTAFCRLIFRRSRRV